MNSVVSRLLCTAINLGAETLLGIVTTSPYRWLGDGHEVRNISSSKTAADRTAEWNSC